MGYCDIEDKCKICNNKITYRLYIGDNGDTWFDEDLYDTVTCSKCGTKYKVENDDLVIFVE